MGWPEYLILAAVAAWLTATVLWMRRRKKRGESACSGCCASCAKQCGKKG